MGGVGSGIPGTATPLFGSVASGVAMGAECPVLLIPMDSGVPEIKQAAIAFDEVDTLVELSNKTNFLREALSPVISFAHVRYHDEVSEEMMELELLRKMFKNDFPDYPAGFDLLPEGDITKVLTDYALDRDIDLLILGRHARGWVMSLLVPSELPDIVRACPVPMLIVPVS
jgi:hypothetical protein